MVPYLICRGLDCPIALVEKSQWSFETLFILGTGLPACLVFSLKHDGDKSVQRNEHYLRHMCHLPILCASPTQNHCMNRWMILQRDYGQLGNCLHTYANAIAWCLENKPNFVNLSFLDMPTFFSGMGTHSFLMLNKSIFSFLSDFDSRNLLDRICRSDKWLNRACKIFKVHKKTTTRQSGKRNLMNYSKMALKKVYPCAGLGSSLPQSCHKASN